MNPSRDSHKTGPDAWNRLTVAARQHETADSRSTVAPYGFATRVVTHAFGTKSDDSFSQWSTLAVRIFGVACLLAIITVSTNLSTILREVEEDSTALSRIESSEFSENALSSFESDTPEP